MRSKTKKRLALLLLAAAAVIVLMTSAFFALQWKHNNAAKLARAAAYKALERGDLVEARNSLGVYLNRYPNDVQALFTYAITNKKIPQPNAKYLVHSVYFLQRVIDLQPDHAQAHHALLQLLTDLGWRSEALVFADKLLDHAPQDPEAWRAKAVALARLNKYQEALDAIDHFNKRAPVELPLELLALEMMRKLGKQQEQIIEHVEALQKSHPDDPRFDLLITEVHRLAGNHAQAIPWLDKAIAKPIPDPITTKIASGMLDFYGRFAESQKLLANSPFVQSDLILLRVYCLRLWELNQDEQVIAQLEKLNPDSLETDTQLIALKAMSLIRAKHDDQAQPLLDALTKRTEDAQAQAWTLFITDLYRSPIASDPKKVIEQCLDVLARSNAIAPVHVLLSQTYAQINEYDLSLREAREANALSPTWALPFVRMSHAFLNTGQITQAAESARFALMRAPFSTEAAIAWTAAKTAGLVKGDSEEAPEKTLELINQILKVAPSDPQTLLLQIALLNRSGKKEEAINIFKAAMEKVTASNPSFLLNMADASRSLGFGLEEACLDQYEKIAGPTLELVYAKAILLAYQNKVEQGLKLLDSHKDPNPSDQSRQAAEMMRARFLIVINHPDAPTAVGKIAQAHPDNLNAQMMAINPRANITDRELLDRAIQRVRKIAGEKSIAWRLAKARWLLTSKDEKRDLPAAISQLNEILDLSPDMVEPRLLLASAYNRAGNPAAAVRELTVAVTQNPTSNPIALELAEALQAQGEYDRAATQIDKVISSSSATPAEVRRAAALLVQRGEIDRSIALLQKFDSRENASTGSDLFLANLYYSRNEVEKAGDIVRKFLAAKPTPAQIEFAAEFYASTGENALAQQTLARLEELNLPPENRSLILARHHYNHGSPHKAAQLFEEAVNAAPAKAVVWRNYLSFLIQQGDTAPLLEKVAQASQAMPDDPLIATLNQQADLINAFKPQIPLSIRNIITAIATDPVNSQTAAQVLKIVSDALTNQEPSQTSLAKLSEAAERAQLFLPLQNMLARTFFTLGLYPDAVKIASRTSQNFPLSIDAAAVAAQALASSGRWSEAQIAAERWKKLTPKNPMQPELLIAESLLQQNRPLETIARITPFLAHAATQPQDNPKVLEIAAKAKLALGQKKHAAELLAPLLPDSEKLRAAWIDLASSALLDEKTAEAWLNQVTPLIPNTSPYELYLLAQGWISISQRHHQPRYLKIAIDHLNTLSQQPDPRPEMLLLYALTLDGEGRQSESEKIYRKVLQLTPNAAVAKNNLAMYIVDTKGDLQDALKLAASAVHEAPQNTVFIDTLAIVQSNLKDYTNAIANWLEAARLEPTNPLWPVCLAEHYLLLNKPIEAASMVTKVETLLSQGAQLPPLALEKLKSIQHDLKQTNAANP